MRFVRIDLPRDAEAAHRFLWAEWHDAGSVETQYFMTFKGLAYPGKGVVIVHDSDFELVDEWLRSVCDQPQPMYEPPTHAAIMGGPPVLHISHLLSGEIVVRSDGPSETFGTGRRWVDITILKGDDARARADALLERFMKGEGPWSLKAKH